MERSFVGRKEPLGETNGAVGRRTHFRERKYPRGEPLRGKSKRIRGKSWEEEGLIYKTTLTTKGSNL